MEEFVPKFRQANFGSVEKRTETLWVYENGEMVHRSVSYVPALYNIFDGILAKAGAIKIEELLAKAAANEQRNNSSSEVTMDVDQRHSSMNTLKVTIDVDRGLICVSNNGSQFPKNVEKCFSTQLKEFWPSNDDGKEREKMVSAKFVRTSKYGKLVSEYKQVVGYTMEKKNKKKPGRRSKGNQKWETVSFEPQLECFKMTKLEDDVVALMKKRVVDWAGILNKSVKVELNGRCVPMNSFTDYAVLYLQAASKSHPTHLFPRIGQKFGDRWQICVSLSEAQFKQVSFVNGVTTIKGGTHVDYVTDQINKHSVAVANKNENAVKNSLWVFVNSLVDKPIFDSPAKETLVTNFGSDFELSPEFLDDVDTILRWENCKQSEDEAEQSEDMAEQSEDGAEQSEDRDEKQSLTRLVEATEAGGQNSDKCTLILAVGDVAASFVRLGISAVGVHDYYGVFSLTKQLLNAIVDGNDEDIQHFKEILGLEDKKEYKSAESLRYGHLMIMTDKEHDGSYFTGLLINFIYTSWPSGPPYSRYHPS